MSGQSLMDSWMNTTQTTTTTASAIGFNNITDSLQSNDSSKSCTHFKAGDFVHSASTFPTATRTLVAFAFIFIMVINVFGNLVVIVVVIIDRPLRRITSGLIVSLAAADILVAMSAETHSIFLILNDQSLHVSHLLCELSTSADLYFSLCELLHLACLASERCLAICYPFHYERISRVFLWCIVVLAWTLPLAFSFLPIVAFDKMVASNELYECLQNLNIGICVLLPDKFFSILLFSVMFILPTSVMFYCYTRICMVAYSQRKRLNSISLGTFARSRNASLNDETSGTYATEMVPMTSNSQSFCDPNIELGNNDDDGSDDDSGREGAKSTNTNTNGNTPHSHLDRNTHNSGIYAETPLCDLNLKPEVFVKQQASKPPLKTKRLPKNKDKDNDDFKAARSIGLLCLFFLITWAPYWLSVLLLPFVGYAHIGHVFMGVALWLNFLGTALNPFIYYFSNTAVKEGILRVVRRFYKHPPKFCLSDTQHKV